MTVEITRRDFLLAAATTAAVAVAAPGQLIRPEALLAAGLPSRQPDGGFIYHPPMSSGIPLGGMGAGTFEIRADGRTHEWQIFNNWGSRISLPNTFFAVQASGEHHAAVARRLETVTDKSLPGTPVEQIEYEGRFPFAQLTYDDPHLPVKVELTAWSPFIPHQPRESGLPAAIFTFTVTNPSSKQVQASILASIANMVGLRGTGTRNVITHSPTTTAIRMEPGAASAATVSRPINVLVLMETTDDRNALQEAMNGVPGLTYDWPDIGDGVITLSATSAEELHQKYDGIWIGEIGHSSDSLGASNMAMIREAVKLGTGLLLVGGWDSFYGHDTDRWAHFNGTPLEDALPVTFSGQFDSLAVATSAHILKPAPFAAAPPTDVQFGGYSKVASVKADGKTLITADDGTPLLVIGNYGLGRTAVWAPGAIGGWVPGNWDKAEYFRSLTCWLSGAVYGPELGVPKLDPAYGTMTLAALSPHKCSAAEWNDMDRLWKEFSEHGTVSSEPKSSQNSRNIAAAQTVTLRPLETTTITFTLTWHFPNHYDNSVQRNWVGHQYNHWFTDSDDVVREVSGSYVEWYEKSRAFQDSLYASTLPPKVVDAINSQLTTFTKETWWAEDGSWAVWEGMTCCGLQTLDVGFYGSVPIALFFPEQEKVAMRLSARHQNDAGKMPHSFPGTFMNPDGWDKIDLMPKFALMAYRDYQWSGDFDYLKEMWPVIKRAMDYDKGTDANKDWLPDDHGADETYDTWPMEGTTSYVSSLWLAALAACIRMASILGDDVAGADYANWLIQGQKSFDSELWNGRYYQMSRSIANNHQSTGVMLAGMIGQWKAHMCDLGYVFPRDKVRSHLLAAFQYCRQATRPGMYYVNPNDGICYVNADWPDGTGPDGEGQWNGPWTGVEYMFASALGYEGLINQANTVVSDVYDRYAKRLAPWNHVECGEHYYRPLSVWGVLLAAQGFRWDANGQSIGFTPRAQVHNHRSLFCTSKAWGDYYATTVSGRRQHEIVVKAGTLTIKQFTVGLSAAEGMNLLSGVKVTNQGHVLTASADENDGRLDVNLTQPITLSPGDHFNVSWRL